MMQNLAYALSPGYYGAFFCKKEYRETRAQKKEGSSTKVSEETTARIAKALEALK